MKTKVFLCMVLPMLLACSSSDNSMGFLIFSNAYDFGASQDGWIGDFADYPIGGTDSTFYELKFDYTDRPANLVPTRKSILLSGNNHSDDLFMFIKKKVSGLQPNVDYTLVFDVELASNAQKNQVGAGGAPGENVYLKVGASSTEPLKIVDGDFYRLNIDKGNQGNGGANMKVIGNIAIDSDQYTLITRNSSNQNSQFVVRTNNKGELWLIVGTDSGFEGTTTLYYTRINVVFSTSN